jgi:hypothetical protein
MNIAYAKDSRGEFQESPRIKRLKSFHYMLQLNEEGEIVGGYFLRGSSIIDLLWIPLRPKQGRQEGNERGNPYVNVDEVLAIWRASVSEDVRKKWPVIDPPAGDRILDLASFDGLVPVQDPEARARELAAAAEAERAAREAAAAAEAAEAESAETAAETEAADAEAAETATEDTEEAGVGR